MERAAREVVAVGGQATDHIGLGGWYSHSVLGKVLTHGGKALQVNRLTGADYHALLLGELFCGALVNQNGRHWIALVKENGLLWHVDSCSAPRVLDEAGFKATLRAHPNTYPVGHLGA